MGILNQLFKAIWESNAGKIHWNHNMWALIGSRWDKVRIVNKNFMGKESERFTKEGCLVNREDNTVLVYRYHTSNCPCPPGDDFYVGDKGRAWVPATECRKCPHHRAKSKQFPFARCVFSAPESASDVADSTIGTFNGFVDTAIEKAKEITG